MARSLQFSATFLAVEDRLQLQGAFPDGTEVRLLLTRRITGGLLSLIEEVSDRLVEPRIAAPEIKKQIAQFSRETAVEQADFAQTFAAGKVHPMMAGGPRLVTEVSVTPHEGEEVTLIFKLDQSERVNMKMPAAALWGLAHLLQQLAERAEWRLTSSAPTPSATATEPRLN